MRAVVTYMLIYILIAMGASLYSVCCATLTVLINLYFMHT